MLKAFLKTSFRNLLKYRVSSITKILGLTIGMACCIMIFSLIRYESSFDDFHEKRERIYRVNLTKLDAIDRQYNGNNFYPLGAAIRSDVSVVENVTSVHCERAYTFKAHDDLFQGRFAFFVDHEYPKIFDLKWIAGNPETNLSEPNTAVVTDEFANRYLDGVDHALNSVIAFNGRQDLLITGVVAKPPSNTDHPYSILISYSSLITYLPHRIDRWDLVERGSTYVLLPDRSSLVNVNEQINQLIPKNFSKESARQTSFSLMPLGDLHDNNGNFNNYNYEFPFPLMIILLVLASVVLLASCMNYINLATAEGITRANEVGIRKTFGAQRKQLAFQFLSETFMVTIFSLVLAVVVARIGMWVLAPMMKSEAFKADFINGFDFMIVFTTLVVLVSLFAGFYPSLVLSRMKPIAVLRNNYIQVSGRGRLRKGLIVAQFAIVQILILVTFIQINQINFLRAKPLGYNNEHVISMVAPKAQATHAPFITTLSSIPGITHVTGKSDDKEESISLPADARVKSSAVTTEVDENYVSTLQF